MEVAAEYSTKTERWGWVWAPDCFWGVQKWAVTYCFSYVD